MAGTTTHKPMKVNDILNTLKLVPLNDYLQVQNSDGIFYVRDIEIIDECTVSLVLMPVPQTKLCRDEG